MERLKITVVAVALGLFGSVMFVSCVLYGLVVPGFHNAQALEAVLPGFQWLTPQSVLLGIVETFLYGLYAGTVLAVIYNGVVHWLKPLRSRA